jgi:cytochrome c556
VRWQRDAATARDLMARASSHARVSSTQVFREAQQRHQDLQDLVRGSQLSSEAGEKTNSWSEFADRRMLMQRLDASLQRQLAEWLAGSQPFQQNQAAIVREAELTAAIARVLVQEGMDDAGGEDYDGWCRQLAEAATKIAAAARAGEYAPAREAHGNARKSCTDCHAVYRAQ